MHYAHTLDENIIDAPKLLNIFKYFHCKFVHFQYGSSNIRLFSIALYLVIALPTLQHQVVALNLFNFVSVLYIDS